MDAAQKRILKAVSLELRHLLEGRYDEHGRWMPGDLEERLASIGIWRDRDPKPLEELQHLSLDDHQARLVVDAYLQLRREAGISRAEAVAEFVRETAYTWVNRLLALRCMEARDLIDEVILQKEVYGGRSLAHHRLIGRNPALSAAADDGLFAMLVQAFTEQAKHLPLLFTPKAPGVALKPSVAALKRCIAYLSGTEAVRGQEPSTREVFQAPDALGWAYQYWNTEEKDRVFETVRTKKGAKIEGADIVPATQLYTEDYMVKFLVQNSLGATWAGIKPDTQLVEKWEYFIWNADRAPMAIKPVRDITFLDPACGSGHFLIEAFDLFFDMYMEEGEITGESAICASILTNNLFGIDIDQRAVQISEAALWMKAAEKAFGFTGTPTNLVATKIRLPRNKDHLRDFLVKHPEDKPLAPALEAVFEALQHADELGSLLLLEEPVEKELWLIKEREDEQASTIQTKSLFSEYTKPVQTLLPINTEDWDTWKTRTVERIREHFSEHAEVASLQEQFFGVEAEKGWKLFELLGREHDVVAANPPWMGSKNMGKTVYSYLARYYPSGKRDTYAAFVLRCTRLCKRGGYTAMITQQAWLFLKAFASMRSTEDSGSGDFKGLLNTVSWECLVQLGRYAFSELGNAVIQPALLIFRNQPPRSTQRIFGIRLKAPRLAHEQAEKLRACSKVHSSSIVSVVEQKALLSIPESPVVYWLRSRFFQILQSEDRVNLGRNRISGVHIGLCTGHNDRFVRFTWECSSDRDSWPFCARAGRYQKWWGLNSSNVLWKQKGREYSETGGSAVRSVDKMFRTGVTYGLMSSGAMGARLLTGDEMFEQASVSLIPYDTVLPEELLAILNTRVVSYLLRVVTQDLKFNAGYVERLPYVWPSEYAVTTVKSCVALKQRWCSIDPLERVYAGEMNIEEKSKLEAVLATLEGFVERCGVDSYSLDDADTAEIISETGSPAGWFPLLHLLDELPVLTELSVDIPEAVREHLLHHCRIQLAARG